MNQARRWGGHELGCAAVVEIVSKVAEGDGSSGWVLGLLASHFWLCSVFGDELQKDMGGTDPTAMMSSSFAARQWSVVAEGDGYRVSGQWPYSSGSPTAPGQWWASSCCPSSRMAADAPVGIVPRSDYSIADEWDTCALRGTASNTLVLEDVFIPEYRTVDPALILAGMGPGRATNTGSVFGLGFAAALGWYLGSTALGCATQATADFASSSAKKVSTFTGQPVLSEPLTIHVGTASAMSRQPGPSCGTARPGSTTGSPRASRSPARSRWPALATRRRPFGSVSTLPSGPCGSAAPPDWRWPTRCSPVAGCPRSCGSHGLQHRRNLRHVGQVDARTAPSAGFF